MTPTPSASASKDFTTTLLARAHSPTTAARIHAEKIKQKPLILVPPFNAQTGADAREARRKLREQREAQRRPSRKTKVKQAARPLNAKEKRAKGIYEIPKAEAKWSIYIGLERMWCAYMREVLSLDKNSGGTNAGKIGQAARYGPLLASADYHGAWILVVRSKCASLVGLEGIVVREGKFSFTVITKKDQVKIIPKHGTVFSIRVPITEPQTSMGSEKDQGNKVESQADVDTVKGAAETAAESGQDLVFELYGDQFQNRAAERANKRFKRHIPKDL